MNPEETETRISESCNRSLRAALHKNSVEQTNCESTTRILDAQRKCAFSRLTREEQDVRQQLQLLQLEQKQLSADLATGTACGSDPSSPLESDLSPIPDQRSVGPGEVVNPYPITSRSKTNSGPNTQPDQNTVGSSSTRCLTRDLNDLDLTASPRPWPGDLEAISSIRRALKPPCRQRIDQQQQQQQQGISSWARSRSLKERPQSSALTRLHAMLRSKSLRGPDKARLSLSSPSAAPAAASSPIDAGGGTCSRSGSLKDRPRRQFLQRRTAGVDEATAGHGRLRRSVSLKTEPDCGGSRGEEERRAAAPPRQD